MKYPWPQYTHNVQLKSHTLFRHARRNAATTMLGKCSVLPPILLKPRTNGNWLNARYVSQPDPIMNHLASPGNQVPVVQDILPDMSHNVSTCRKIMACAARTYPLRQPPNHKPPIPRWQLVLGENVNRIFTAYIGIQPLSGSKGAVDKTARSIQTWLDGQTPFTPQATETFGVIDGDDTRDAKVWACYWDDEAKGKQGLHQLGLSSIYYNLPKDEQMTVGLWSESFSTLVS